MNLNFGLLNGKEVERELLSLAKQAGVDARKFADEAAAVGMKALVRTTQPFGLAGKAKRLGENAVRRDLARAFQIVPDGARGNDIIRTMGGAAMHHKSVRDSRGRVNRNVKKRKITAAVFFQYMAKKIKWVGRAKGSFSTAADDLGVRGLQKWISRSKGEGRSRRSGRVRKVTWELHGLPDYVASNNVLGPRGAARVLKSSERNLRKSFEARVRRKMKAAERRLNN